MTEPAPSSSNNNNEQDLERAFQLIKEGKQQRDDGENWVAAEQFWQAQKVLRKLAHEQPDANDDDKDEETKKIQSLYEQQSQDYFLKARETFMEAMEVEHEMDVEKRQAITQSTSPSSMEYCCQELSDEEARKRVQLFASIFAKELEPVVGITANADDDDNDKEAEYDVQKKQSSIEERLMELNATIPKGFKTSDERMQDINRGLNRLGLSLYTEGPTKPKVEPTKSTSQQVADIIAQASDEVAMERKTSATLLTTNDQEGEDSEVVLSDDSDSINSGGDDDDSVLSDEIPKLQNVQKIRDQVAAAQAKLAELVALMDTIPSAEEEEEAALDSQDKLASSPSSFDPAFGKKTLKDANDSLRKALKLWKVKASPS